jgi:hypothetical protein
MKAIKLAIEALESCRKGGYRDIDGDWCERLWFDKEKVAAALAALRGQADDAKDAQWHAEADRLKKCFDYATSGMEQENFRRLLSAHLNKAAALIAVAAEAKGQTQ